jgi:hypothetical protein
MLRIPCALALFLAATAGITPAVSEVTTLDPANVTVHDYQNSIIHTTPGTYSDGMGGVGSAALGPVAGVHSSTSTTNFDSQLVYYFSADGPSDAMVPIDVQYTLETAAVGYDARGYAAISVFGLSAGACTTTAPLLNSCNLTGYTGDQNIFGGHLRFSLPSNTEEGIFLDAEAVGFPDSTAVVQAPLFASATADPLITILALGFTLHLSPGIANSTAAVPEASVWAEMIIGLGAIGAMARRRRSALPQPLLGQRLALNPAM